MAQVITISLNDEASEIVEKLKANNLNVSEAFCNAVVAYWKRKISKAGRQEASK